MDLDKKFLYKNDTSNEPDKTFDDNDDEDNEDIPKESFIKKNKKILILIFIIFIILILYFLVFKNKCNTPGSGNLNDNCGRTCDKVCSTGLSCTGGKCV